ncbi:MAG: glycosyl hydrolase [Catalinimonas sp.]
MNFFRNLKICLAMGPALAFATGGAAQSLEAGFDDPPVSARPKGYWVLVSGNFSLSRMTEELREYKEKGMGGVDIWDVPGWVDEEGVIPPGPRFMGDESLQAIAHGIREGKRLGMEMGLILSSSWNAGGDWVPPEDGVMGLFRSHTRVSGPMAYDDPLAFPDLSETAEKGMSPLLALGPDGRPAHFEEVAVFAYPHTTDTSRPLSTRNMIDLSEHFENGRLTWDAPAGTWEVVRYVAAGTGQPLKRPSPNSNGLMIDHFSAEAMRHNMNYLFERLHTEFPALDTSGLAYLYTDSYEANSATWTAGMPEIFERRNGYALGPYLPALAGKVVDGPEVTRRFLFDFRNTLSDLIVENHYALGKEMCEEQGIGFVAEAGGPGPPLHNTPFESLRALGVLTTPRGEFWFDPLRSPDHIEYLQIVKGPASAAHLYDQPRVEAEAFTGTQLWQFGPGDLKRSTDRALAEGLTSFIYHTTPHVPPEAGTPGWVYNFGTIVNTTRAWWPKSAPFHEYIARSCFLLQQGNFVGDALYYYGDEAPNFIDHNRIKAELGFGYDYDGVNSDVILNRLDVRDGKFVLPHGATYRVLVLPDGDRVDPAVLRKIAELVEKGGVVLGNRPRHSYGLKDYRAQDAEVARLAKQMWRTNRPEQSYGRGRLFSRRRTIREVFAALDVVPDVAANLPDAGAALHHIHRRTDDADVYFLSNKTAGKLVFEGTFRTDRGAPELWDAKTGRRQQMPVYVRDGGTTTLPLVLEPEASVFVVFQGAPATDPIVRVLRDGAPLFPGTRGSFPLSFEGEQVVLSEPGDFRFTRASGTTRDYRSERAGQTTTLAGAWEVRFPFGWGAPPRTTFDTLHAWNADADTNIRYFSGVAAYHKTFVLTEAQVAEGARLTLDLGEVAEVAEVFLNGHPVDVLWHAPYRCDITEHARAGTNYLVVEVANVLANRLIGDARRPPAQRRTHTNISRLPNAWMTPFAEAELRESGLLGPVRVHHHVTPGGLVDRPR